MVVWSVFFFFFKQKTAYEMRISDWSSDVCSSDLTTSPACGARPRSCSRTAAASPSTPRAPSTARTSPSNAAASTRCGFAPTTAARAPPSSRSPGPATTATSPTPPSRGRYPADRPATAPPLNAYVALLRRIAPPNPKVRNAELRRVIEDLGLDAVSPVHHTRSPPH